MVVGSITEPVMNLVVKPNLLLVDTQNTTRRKCAWSGPENPDISYRACSLRIPGMPRHYQIAGSS